VVEIPAHAYLDALGTTWDCQRGYLQTDDGCIRIIVPDHAHLSDLASDTGWQCDRGYRDRNDSSCVAIRTPPHAHPVYDVLDEAYGFAGEGWSCDWGYRASGDHCIAITVPKNGFLVASGDDWGCRRGYLRKDNSSCVALRVPAMGHLDFSGHNWVCDSGYHRAEGRCVAVREPPHAYVTYESEGSGWQCDRGYRMQRGDCVAIHLPPHAFLLDAGAAWPGWECDRGFHREGSGCQPLKVPLNAHIDASGNDWMCDPDYVHLNGRCLNSVSEGFDLAAFSPRFEGGTSAARSVSDPQ